MGKLPRFIGVWETLMTIIPRPLARSPAVPTECSRCAVKEKTVCRPFQGPALDVVQSFKLGDRILPAGANAYSPGQELTELYNLLDGWVAVYRILATGRRQIVDIALPGSFLGYQPELAEPMMHGAECLTDVALCVFPRRKFHDFALQQPDLSLQLAKLQARALIRTQDHLTNVGARSALERVAYLLCAILERLRPDHASQLTELIEIPLTQSQIGEALGLSSVYVNRTLRELREEGVVVLKSGQLRVLDYPRLAELADLEPECPSSE